MCKRSVKMRKNRRWTWRKQLRRRKENWEKKKGKIKGLRWTWREKLRRGKEN